MLALFKLNFVSRFSHFSSPLYQLTVVSKFESFNPNFAGFLKFKPQTQDLRVLARSSPLDKLTSTLNPKLLTLNRRWL